MRPSLATDRISLGFWLNISFVVNYPGAFRSIVAIAIDLLASERPIFALNHSGASAAMVFKNPTTFGVTLALSGPPNLRPGSDHRYLILLLFHQPITSPKLYLPSVRSVVFVKTQLQYIQSSLITMRYVFFSAPACTSNPPSPLVGCDSWWRQAVEPASWLRNDLSKESFTR